MSSKIDYVRLLREITDKASMTYSLYKDYSKDPISFKEKDIYLFMAFQFAEKVLGNAKDHFSKESIQSSQNTSFSLAKCYEILECSPSDSNEKIKENYKRLVKEYHPDTIAGKNLAKGFNEFANQKFKEIHGAYELIKSEKKF